MPIDKHVQIFTDGSCLGNPGPGGYGVILRYGKHEKELAAGYRLTTNNRMEILAAVVALKSLRQGCKVDLYTDSEYVRQGITQWIAGWKKRDWRTASRQPVKNRDLWQQLDEAIARHQITWHWVKGHSGHPENDRCDALARHVAEKGPHAEDIGYQPAITASS